ncbi:MAG: hypothetical protein ABIE94_02685 [archaeon]
MISEGELKVGEPDSRVEELYQRQLDEVGSVRTKCEATGFPASVDVLCCAVYVGWVKPSRLVDAIGSNPSMPEQLRHMTQEDMRAHFEALTRQGVMVRSGDWYHPTEGVSAVVESNLHVLKSGILSVYDLQSLSSCMGSPDHTL